MQCVLSTPQINRERVGAFKLREEGGYRDVALLQDCESAVWSVCDACGWSRALKELIDRERPTHNQYPPPSTRCH